MTEADANLSATIGPYRVLQLLGKGGMGRVYLALDQRLDRYVALKSLDGLSLERRSLVFAEAKTLAKLNHPSIVQIYDVIEHDGQPILVMEYVEGEDLEKQVERQPLSPVTAVRVAISIASALAEAHRRGIIHRDLKLANILLPSSGIAKLTDFGIAQLLGVDGLQNIAKGSVMAMSPEQASGVEVDGRSDLFALGVIIYQILSGRNPFDGAKNPRTYFKQLLYDSHLSLSVLLPEVPKALSMLVDQLLEKSSSMRPACAADVKKRLEAIEMSLAVEEQDTLVFTPGDTDVIEEKPSIEIAKGLRFCPSVSGLFSGKFIAVAILVLLFIVSGQAYLRYYRSEAIVVAVLLPTIKNPVAVNNSELLKTSFQQAVVDALLSVSHTHLVTFDEGRELFGSPVEIAQQLQVDEVLASYMECVESYCHAALRRYSQSGLQELADLRIPINSYPTINTLVGNAARGLYPQAKPAW